MAGTTTTSDTIASLERRSVVDALDAMVPIVVVDEEGRIVYANERWCRIAGATHDGILGLHWTALVHPDDLPDAVAVARSVQRTGTPVTHETRIVSREGTPVTWLQVQVSPLEADGDRRRWVIVAIDVTGRQQAEQELRRSERRLEVIAKHSPDVITVVEPDGTLRSTTAPLDRLFGEPAPEKVEDVLAWVHPEDRAQAVRSFFSLLRNGEDLYGKLYEIRMCAPDGRVRWIETTGVNLIDEPAVGGLVLISRDVTARHEVEDELRAVSSRLAALVEHLHLGVHLSDEAGRVLTVNPALSDLLGLTGDPEEQLGSTGGDRAAPFAELLQDPERDLARCEELVRAGRLAVGERFTLRGGRTLSADYVPVTVDGKHGGHLWLLRDVTDDLAAAAEREYLLEVERRQNARLTELDAMKTHLVSSVSHELRTPLTSIRSFTQLLRTGLPTAPVAEQAEFLDVVERNTDRLLRLVDELLLLDRLESGVRHTAVGKVDLAEVVRQAVASIRPTADAKGVTLKAAVREGPGFVGDVDRVGQLVDNLLSNAVKFTPAHGDIAVAAEPVPDGWRLEVADTGIGIPASEQGQLFERFFRASNARREAVPGSGLGLAIVRLVAERHGGHVEVRSAEGAGTTVSVTLRGLSEQPGDAPGGGAP